MRGLKNIVLGVGLLFGLSNLYAQEIVLKDQLNHPVFSWPQSLIHYTVNTKVGGVTDASGQQVAFQQEGNTLYLLTDLPSGGEKRFKLQSNGAKTASRIDVVQQNGQVSLSNGKVQVTIPAPGSTKLTAPVIRMGNAASWLAYGEWPSAYKNAMMSVRKINAGALFATYAITYDIKSGRQYTATIRLTADMEFVEIEEKMKGFNAGDTLSWRLVWNGVHPRNRHIATRGTATGKTYETMQFEPMEGLSELPEVPKHPLMKEDQQNGPDGLLPFHISSYDNWMTWWRVPAAAFWSDTQSIGVFITDTEKWNDEAYPLWGSKNNLSIRFHWKNNVLDYSFPFVQGSRASGIAVYDHRKDIDFVNKTAKPLAYIDELRRWYGWVPLDKVKNWILDYPSRNDEQTRYFTPQLAGHLPLGTLETSLRNQVASVGTGSERNGGPTPVGSRVFYESLGPSFDVNRSRMSKEQYKRLRAWFLFMNYVLMDEALMPMRTMLSGHPNFLMDVKGVAGVTVFLFPDHPQATEMAEHFEKSVRLNNQYHIRPAVAAWNAKGGRWTENLATYTWAALRPLLHANFLLHDHFDGRNRMLQPGVSMLGDWLLNTLTAPLDLADNKRTYPPQGAHALLSDYGPPDLLRHFAQEVYYYDPLLAEHIFYVTAADDRMFEHRDKNTPWRGMLDGEWKSNKGTPLQMRSAKYTGYGFILRSNFGKKDEMYVNLEQIDDGPNYRWGRAGGNGVIYYYAAGKRYSSNGPEDVGDGPFGDVERCTNFGVRKAAGYRDIGPYRSVGRNDLTAPLYDFRFAQMATVYGDEDYRSRSVLQSGADYIVVLDDVKDARTEGRFSWFVSTRDSFPFIHQLQPGVTPVDADIKPSQSGYHKDPPVLPTRGRYYDGKGDFFTVVTHRPGLITRKTPYGCDVQFPDGHTDRVFRTDATINYNGNGIIFKGTAGIVQANSAALFEGTEIAAAGLHVQTDGGAIGFEKTATGYRGVFQSDKPQQVKFSSSLKLYIDGVPQTQFPAGRHEWQLTNDGVIPSASAITGVVVRSHGCSVSWKNVPGAASYQLQVSKDNGITWASVQGNTLKGFDNGIKLQLRVITKGAGGEGEPSDAYPAYITDKAPHHPDGLIARLYGGKAHVSWGEVLGASQYKLYRRKKGTEQYQPVYTGTARTFTDNTTQVWEYVVAAINGNGEGLRSPSVDTDPAKFLNQEPRPEEGFRRDTENHENGFPEFDPLQEDRMPILRYPAHPADKKVDKP